MATTRIWPAVILAASLAACGRDSRPAAPCDAFEDAGCIQAAAMMADVESLASDAFAGRGVGGAGNAAAVALAESRFAGAGLAPPPGGAGYLQSFQVDHWEATAATLAIGGSAVPLGSGFEVVIRSGSGTVGDAPMVFVGYGLQVPPFDPAAYPDCPLSPSGHDDYAGVDATGKVAVALRGLLAADSRLYACPLEARCFGSPSCYGRASYKARVASANGAAGLLLATPYTAASGAPVPFTSAGVQLLPTLMVDRDTLAAALPDLPTWAAAIDSGYAPSSHETAVAASVQVAGAVLTSTVSNVLGIVPGTDPVLKDLVVVVGAHLDHMGRLPLRSVYFPGADDNASGTAAVLELSRAVAASPTRPRRTLLFALWNAEELGLLGSCHYAYADPRLPLASTVAAFSVDMVGAGTPGLELWGGQDHPWMPQLATQGAAALGLPWVPVSQPALLQSDHACFVGQGVPGFLASTPTIFEHPSYHTVNDVAAGVSRQNLASAARLLWAGVRGLAAGESPWVLAPAAPAAARVAPRESARIGPGFLRD
ncbi:MAG TPA: M28 family peptidase [Anaeromyxobacteraceae bacterium]|nr:M28 family peptidase [Anaeromyxobacteraceae bacterium]